MRTRLVSIIIAAAALATASQIPASPVPAEADPKPVVGADYFSTHINFSLYGDDKPRVRRFERVLRRVRAVGFREVRVVFSWREMEPRAPLLGVHRYRWGNFDRYVEMAAARGIRLRAVLGYPPRWASTDSRCVDGDHIHSGEPARLADWAASVEAFVERYGRYGVYWHSNPRLPRLPISSYEIWNEPNLMQFWCPRPNPERYAQVLRLASSVIHARDRRAQVLFGGVISARNRPAADPSVRSARFFRTVFKARPRLAGQIDGIGVHVYEFRTIGDFFGQVARFRRELRRSGVPRSVPLFVTETGWLHRPAIGYTEAKRIRFYKAAIRGLPRSDCNVDGMTAYAWLTAEEPGRLMSFLGLADRRTLKPYRVVRTIHRQLAIMRGIGNAPPPVGGLNHC